jgi:hypothetical protein
MADHLLPFQESMSVSAPSRFVTQSPYGSAEARRSARHSLKVIFRGGDFVGAGLDRPGPISNGYGWPRAATPDNAHHKATCGGNLQEA